MYPSGNIISASSFFHFPSPFLLPYEDDDQLFLQNLHDLFTSTDNNMSSSTQTVININNKVDSPTISTILDPLKLKQAADVPKKRSSKKDRHSKINTAHGPRDRRMRLSLDVARKFFSLQDILGFEKASKTVDWLLSQSRSEIEELTRGHNSSIGAANSTSSASECEVLSGTDHEPKPKLGKSKEEGKDLGAAKDKEKAADKKKKKKKKKKKGIVTRVAFDSTARELREKARERARERTARKRTAHNLSQIGCPSLLAQNGSLDIHLVQQIDELSPRPRARHDQSHVDHEQGSNKDHDMIFADSFWSSSTFFNYQNNSTSSSHQFAEFHGYNN